LDLGLKGRVAIVSGSSQGIGYATARALAGEGASVTMTARRIDDLTRSAEKVRSETGAEVLTVQGDVASASDNQRFVEETVARFGRVDILVNNDGAPPVGLLETFDDAAWEAAVQRNLMSVVRMVRHCLPHMRKAGGGRIINVTTASLKNTSPSLGLSIATWAGVVGFAKTLALEIGRDQITVNTICPGRIATPRLEKVMRKKAESQGSDPTVDLQRMLDDVPIGRLGTADDVAGFITFLASERGAFITGTTIQVDGGLVRSLL
jgi:3-oxoacyl-[acyl-carrier protein] reductase